MPGRIAWDEIWPIIGPQIEQVMGGGGATWHENHLVPITRHGRLEQVYWTYSYGPIDDETAPGGVGGVLVLCTETTAQVLAAERMRAADARWRALFEQAPGFMCILQGPEHRYEYANARYMSLVGHRPIVGKTLLEALPEDRRPGDHRAARSGVPDRRGLHGEAAPVHLPTASRGSELFYLDFVYQPIRDDSGGVTGIFVEGSDVTERKLAEIGQRDADRRKDEFLATLSHELRNPLAPLRNAATILRSTAATPGTRDWATQVIDRQVSTMARLLDDLLDVTRVSRGTLVLARRRTALSSVFDAAIEVATPTIDARHHQLRVTLPDSPIEIDGDAVRLSQVLSNLLNNAAKYTDAGGTIELSARRVDQTVRIAVKDSGIGLSPESLAGVFDMFSQVKSALDRSEGGLGIGLTLVRALVELHGGRVEVDSKGLGQGSVFSVVLPLAVGTADASGVDANGGHGGRPSAVAGC